MPVARPAKKTACCDRKKGTCAPSKRKLVMNFATVDKARTGRATVSGGGACLSMMAGVLLGRGIVAVDVSSRNYSYNEIRATDSKR
jgi:hypothetical protein